jgi:hypothetical protein
MLWQPEVKYDGPVIIKTNAGPARKVGLFPVGNQHFVYLYQTSQKASTLL